MTTSLNTKTLGAIAVVAACFSQPANALVDLSTSGYYTYGNMNTYSLPIDAKLYDLNTGSGVGPGNPYYVASSPGSIKDLVVIYTGAGGQDVTTNVAGFEDAYQTPNGTVSYASTLNEVGVVDPGSKVGIANPTSNTWDASLFALKTFLNGGSAVFLFNNNEHNKADTQDLAVWMKFWITTPNGSLYNNRYLYLSNEGGQYATGGTLLGDATTYNPGNVQPAFYAGGGTDYVQSGGCVSYVTGLHVDCQDPNAISHNLGANQVAYAGVLPLLNQWMAALADDANLANYTLHIQMNLGCSRTENSICTDGNYQIDNGYEQFFLASTNSTIVDVPEPGTLALGGIALLGLFAASRRRPQC